MSVQYTTSDGDTVDYIAWSYYKDASASLAELILNANPEAADYVVFPAGVVMTLPDLPPAVTIVKATRLWD